MEQREGITMYRIFIVEDDEIISEVLKKNLSSWGYDVSCAEDFSNIIQEFVRRDPQLVLLDLKLPFYNGFQTTFVQAEYIPELKTQDRL